METIRYSPIGKEDCSFGTGAFEVTLADGRVVMLSQIDVGALLNAGLATTTLSGLTLSNVTLSGSPTLASPIISGTVTGTYTLGGTPTITGGVVTAAPTADLGLANKAYVDGKNAVSIMENGRLSVTMASNAVTIAVKGNDGNDPSASNPVIVSFRSSSATSGAYVTRTITTALSTVISAGSTGGMTNGVAARIYVGLMDNAGTPELYWWNPLSGTSLYAPVESELISTTAEGGAGAADSAQVLYSATARNTLAHRVIGYFEVTEATAGTWATGASKIQLLGPGVRRTGDRVQKQAVNTGLFAAGTTAIPFDNTIPQITEGDQYMSSTITPTSAINLLHIMAQAALSQSNSSNSIVMALFQDATANALTANAINTAGVNQQFFMQLFYAMVAGTASATTLKIRAGNASGATTSFNGASPGLMGGSCNSFLFVEEIFT